MLLVLKIRNIFLVLFFASLFSLCANFQTIYASGNDLGGQIKNAIDAANDLKLSETRDWKLILYYYNSWLGEKSLIDDSDFFLSPHGKLDPNLELIETINALYKPKENIPEIELAQCRFPMRTAWLSRKLAEKNVIFPKVKCEELENFISFVNPQGLTLLFSSFYPNNPGSLFGHTLLRVNSKSSLQNRSSTNLLDLGVGFAARPTTNNPFLYLLNGLFGGFTGRFDFNPFYMKVQEYNHSENRDLWEYDLNYTPEQVTDILRSLFEVRQANIDYYYFDDNCAFILLQLLEIGRPDFDLKGKFNSWVIPGDTLRIVALEPGLVNRIQYRPSVFRSFLELQKSLTDAEKKLLESLADRKLGPNEIKLDTVRKILLLDTFLEYIDFDERLAGSKESVKWAIPRKEALVARAQLGQQIKLENLSYTSPLSNIGMPQDERPDLAHPPTRLSYGLGFSAQRKGFLELSWRPALHDLGSRQIGYSKELEIQFFNPSIRLYQEAKKIEFHEFHLLRILAANAVTPLVNQVAWGFNLSVDQTLANMRYRKYMQIEAGKAFSFGGSESRLYLLALVDMGHEKQLNWHVGPGGHVGFVVPLAEQTKVRCDVKWIRHFGISKFENDFGARFQIGQSFGPNWEFDLLGESNNNTNALSVVVHSYF